MEENLLTKKEIAKFLKVSEPTIDRWRKKGMPSIKTGRLVRFNREDVLKWFEDSNSEK